MNMLQGTTPAIGRYQDQAVPCMPVKLGTPTKDPKADACVVRSSATIEVVLLGFRGV
jgi:hypothetical protein